jgi:hypothetical protein
MSSSPAITRTGTAGSGVRADAAGYGVASASRCKAVLGTAVLAAGLIVSPAAAAPAAADTDPSVFTRKRAMTAGDCRISPGATWTLDPDGTARLDAKVSSTSGDDAWLMWTYLLDEDGAVLGQIRVAGGSSTKFVKNLPNAYWTYRWRAKGQFDRDLFDLVGWIRLSRHC